MNANRISNKDLPYRNSAHAILVTVERSGSFVQVWDVKRGSGLANNGASIAAGIR